jgi:hypothetical protein
VPCDLGQLSGPDRDQQVYHDHRDDRDDRCDGQQEGADASQNV